MVQNGFTLNIMVVNALIDMYVKYERIQAKVFIDNYGCECHDKSPIIMVVKSS